MTPIRILLLVMVVIMATMCAVWIARNKTYWGYATPVIAWLFNVAAITAFAVYNTYNPSVGAADLNTWSGLIRIQTGITLMFYLLTLGKALRKL
jgi:hypothetical protein